MTMMMIGDHSRSNPTVQIPPWDCHSIQDPTARIHSPITYTLSPNTPDYENAFAALQRYLPSNKDDVVPSDGGDLDDFDVPVDAFSCDNFRMFEFKVKKCAVARSHDWTECPFAHPGEKARRRDPRRYHYSGGACPDFRKGGACPKGGACEYAHGVFESWLHPARYRTQPCKDGAHCRRRVCFFAHAPEQLRVLPYASSPDSSPPVSPSSMKLNPVTQLAESMRCVQLNKMKMGMGMGLSVNPPAWVGSPRSPIATRPGFASLPSTPIRAQGVRRGFGEWGSSACEEEPLMERVESGRELRERIYAKIGKENSLDRVNRVNSDPDLEWVSELVK